MRAAILLAGVWAICVACGPTSDAPATEPWPVRTEAPGVLGYIALSASPGDLGAAFEQAINWTPAGLSGDRPASILLLDEVVFGGPLLLALPIDDEAAFRASLDSSPSIRHEQGDAWVVVLPAENPVLISLRVLRGMTSARSPADLMAALRGEQGAEWSVHLVLSDGRAIMAPSFEAGLVAQRVYDEIPGFAQAESPLVMSFDFRRFHLAYQDGVESTLNRARAMLLSVQMAGLASMFSGAMRGANGPQDMGLPLPGPAIWAFAQMLSGEEILGAQLTLRGVDVGALMATLPSALEAQGTDTPILSGERALVDVRMVWEPGSPPAQMLAALRPVTEFPGAAALGFDADLFPAALANWARPLVELTMGEGPPAERLMSRIEELLAPCGGTLVAGLEEGGHALALSVRPGAELDVDGMGEILELFAHTLALEPEDGSGGLVPLSDEIGPDGLVPAGRYWQSDDSFFLTIGPCTGIALERLAVRSEEAAAERHHPPGAPFFSFSAGEAAVRMFADGGELLLELPVPTDLGQ